MKKVLITTSVLLLSISAYAEVKIGALLALTGPISNIGKPSQEILEGVIADANKANFMGEKITLVSYDTQGMPDKTMMFAKKLINKDKVDVIVGPTSTGEAMSVIGTIMEAQTPTMGFVGGTPPVEPVRQYMFKSPQKTSTAVEKTFGYLKKKGWTKIGVVVDATGFGQDGLDQINKYAAGFTITGVEKFNMTDTDMTTQMKKILDTKPQAIVVWTVGKAGAVAAKSLRALDNDIPLIQSHGIADFAYTKLAGASAEGSIMPALKIVVAKQLPANDPQKKAIDLFNKRYGKLINETSVHAIYAYDGINLMLNAMKRAKNEKISIVQALETTKNFAGATGVYNITKTDHCGLDMSSLVMVRVKNGQFVLEDM
ncbi:ABC transporter substrate-binding protein [Seleniivibrio sp.]|uniref:ABC transporter substrate-binding protein n=1 Tax=Seleniivibrio sp. TaxID=2898801 RepID=UPI0025E58227|nr:ABC transporter substrate-binding protein [Seleniivibrio sp.]MCD8552625.1 ABC transporter substrate-binding protein [Seleniivibrio sp.]